MATANWQLQLPCKKVRPKREPRPVTYDKRIYRSLRSCEASRPHLRLPLCTATNPVGCSVFRRVHVPSAALAVRPGAVTLIPHGEFLSGEAGIVSESSIEPTITRPSQFASLKPMYGRPNGSSAHTDRTRPDGSTNSKLCALVADVCCVGSELRPLNLCPSIPPQKPSAKAPNHTTSVFTVSALSS
jgi:hypothetical protein